MKIILSVIEIMLMIGAPDGIAKSAYQSGYEHGVADAKCVHRDGCDYYITKPEKGFQFHTRDFINGFVNGFCSIAMPHPLRPGNDVGFEAEEAMFSCVKGPSSADWVITNARKPISGA